jgi:hypothetical protein
MDGDLCLAREKISAQTDHEENPPHQGTPEYRRRTRRDGYDPHSSAGNPEQHTDNKPEGIVAMNHPHAVHILEERHFETLIARIVDHTVFMED